MSNMASTMPFMLSEKSILFTASLSNVHWTFFSSLTFSLSSTGIMHRIFVTSATVVPLTAAMSVPRFPWPSLLFASLDFNSAVLMACGRRGR